MSTDLDGLREAVPAMNYSEIIRQGPEKRKPPLTYYELAVSPSGLRSDRRAWRRVGHPMETSWELV